MNEIINDLTSFIAITASIIGVIFSFWSIKKTRETYYKDFLEKREKRKINKLKEKKD